MSTAGEWEFRLPRDAAELEELWAEARRHGLEPGAHLRVVGEPATRSEPDTGAPRRSMTFIGSFRAEPDLGRNADHYLDQSFGRE